MPTEINRVDEVEITLHDIETLTGWPDLGGYVLIGLGATPAPGGLPRVHMMTDTSDQRQIVALLAKVSSQLRRDAT